MRDTKLLSKSSEGDMIAREVRYHEHSTTKFRKIFANFPTIKNIMLRTFRSKVLKLLQLCVCHLLKILCKVAMKLHLS